MTTVSDPELSLDLSRALQDAQKGDQTAWETLFRECYPKVRRVVRRKLDRSMRSLYDSTDFASDVMKSLAANIDQLSFPSIDSLMRFLAHVAEQKVIDEYRRRHTLKRNVNRERRFRGRRGLRPGSTPLRRSHRQPTRAGQRSPRMAAGPAGRDRAHHHQLETARLFDGGHRLHDRLEHPQGPALPQRPARCAPRLGRLTMKSFLASARSLSGLDRVDRDVRLLEDEWQRHGEVSLERFWHEHRDVRRRRARF